MPHNYKVLSQETASRFQTQGLSTAVSGPYVTTPKIYMSYDNWATSIENSTALEFYPYDVAANDDGSIIVAVGGVNSNGVRPGNNYSWGPNAAVLTGHNGTTSTWTNLTIDYFGGYSTYHAVAYGAGKFVAIDRDGSFSTSTDGVNWTSTSTYPNPFEYSGAYNSPFTDGMTKLAYGNGMFVLSVDIAGGSNGDALILWTSTDGENWSQHTYSGGPTATERYNLQYIDGAWYYLIYSQFNGTYLIKSTDSFQTWTQHLVTENNGTSFFTINGVLYVYSAGPFLWYRNLADIPNNSNSSGGWSFEYLPYSPLSEWAATADEDNVLFVIRSSYSENEGDQTIKFYRATISEFLSGNAVEGVTLTNTNFNPNLESYALLTTNLEGVTQYTVPTSSDSRSALISSIIIRNTASSGSHPVKVGIVKAEDVATPGLSPSQLLIYKQLSAGQRIELTGGMVIPEGAEVRTESDSTDIVVHIYGAEVNF